MNEALVRSESPAGSPHDRRTAATVLGDADGFTVELALVASCRQVDAQTFALTRRTTKTAKSTTLLAEYVVGVVAAVAGALIVYDASKVPAADDRLETNPVGRNGAYGIGGATVTLGFTSLALGLADSWRARDATANGGEVTREMPGTERDVECDAKPLGSTAIELHTDEAGLAPLRVGSTDDRGRLRIEWSVLVLPVLSTANWPTSAAIVVNGEHVGEISLAAPRSQRAEAAWQAAVQTNVSTGFRDFGQAFPEAHQDEVARLYRTARVAELDGEVAAALATDDASGARALVDEWATLDPGSEALAARMGDVDAAERRLARARALKDFDGALGLVRAEVGVSAAIAAAEAALKQFAAVSPDDSELKSARSRLAKASAKALRGLVVLAARATKKADFENAQAYLDEAERVSPGDKAVARSVKKLDAARAAEERRYEKKIGKCTRLCNDDRNYRYADYKRCMDESLSPDFSNFSSLSDSCSQDCIYACAQE